MFTLEPIQLPYWYHSCLCVDMYHSSGGIGAIVHLVSWSVLRTILKRKTSRHCGIGVLRSLTICSQPLHDDRRVDIAPAEYWQEVSQVRQCPVEYYISEFNIAGLHPSSQSSSRNHSVPTDPKRTGCKNKSAGAVATIVIGIIRPPWATLKKEGCRLHRRDKNNIRIYSQSLHNLSDVLFCSRSLSRNTLPRR